MDGIDNPVYKVGDRELSMLDLLRRFSEERYREGGVWRLSDLHLKVGEPARYRFDDAVEALPGGAPLDEEIIRKLLYPLLNERQRQRLERTPPLDVDAGFDIHADAPGFRVNVFHDRDGLACAIRVLPKTVPPVETIGFPDERVWREIVEMRQGLVIVTGITGSGKSTTVASLLQHVNRNRAVRVITLEDPIEYVLRSDRAMISQREVGRHLGSFRAGLRAALREDPDVLFVGEMRDRETTALALSAAETGHLVLSTLHTRDARGAITRIVDMFPRDRLQEVSTQLSFGLSYVVAQKLVPRADGRGRRVAMEVLKNVLPIANLIRSGRWQQLYSTLESQRGAGAITLERHLVELVRAGEVTPETARRYANDPSLVD